MAARLHGVLLVVGAATLFGLFALAMLLRVARWRRLMRGADALCFVELIALGFAPGWFADRFMPIVALAYLTFCGHRAVQWELAHRRDLQRRSLRL